MRGKGKVIVSIGLGLLAAMMMFAYLSGREGELLELSAMKDVFVATEDILADTTIDERHVQRIQVPAMYLQPKAVIDINEARGRVVTVPIAKGAQVLGTYLADAGRAALAHEIRRGHRAITIAVSDVTGVGGLIRPGNFVDIFGTFQYGRPTGVNQLGQMQYAEERTETRMLMQNVAVIAVNQQHRREPAQPRPPEAPELQQGSELSATDPQTNQEIRTVTVLVGLPQAQELVLAQEIGTLTLALRSHLDAGQITNLSTLDPLGLLKVPIPVKPRPGPVWREIRGSGNF